MESNEISLHQAKVFRFVKSQPDWVTAKAIALATDISGRTARSHCFKLVKLGIFDQAEVFPAHRYQFSKFADKRNKAYLQRLEQACAIFSI
jgi:Fic family protein